MTYTRRNLRETHMRKKFDGDSIKIDIDTGGNKAGNGGNGYNYGDIINKPTSVVDQYNKVEGSDVHTNTGDKVYQKAYWDADGGKAEAEKYAKAYGGEAETNGDQKSDHDGRNTSGDVEANVDADQTNKAWVDQSQHVWAGIGGEGGDDAMAIGGNVDIDIDFEHSA